MQNQLMNGIVLGLIAGVATTVANKFITKTGGAA